MDKISILEIAKKLGIAWRTARARVEDGTIPGRRRHPTYRRKYVVDRKTFENWLVSEGSSQKA